MIVVLSLVVRSTLTMTLATSTSVRLTWGQFHSKVSGLILHLHVSSAVELDSEVVEVGLSFDSSEEMVESTFSDFVVEDAEGGQ